MRRSLTPTIVLTLAGFLFGMLLRYRIDPAEEASFANYLRSGLHGAGVTYATWMVHVYFTSRSSEWLRRWPLAAELFVRALVMAAVITIVTTGLQVVLYGLRIEAKWVEAELPLIVGIALVLSILIAAIHELTRLIGGRALFNVLIGRYRRPILEERVLLFLDLAGSTTLAENMGEVRVQDLLKEFFFDIDQPITAHGGEVHAYVGDEVIVTWRAPQPGRSVAVSTASLPSKTGSPHGPTNTGKGSAWCLNFAQACTPAAWSSANAGIRAGRWPISAIP